MWQSSLTSCLCDIHLNSSAGNTDVLQLLNGIATDQICLRKVSNNLEVAFIGTTDKATLSNWG